MNMVEKLRQHGYKVRVTHYRRYNCWDNDRRVSYVDYLPRHESSGLKYALPNGGYTVVNVVTPDDEEFESVAHCSNDDQFVKRRGVDIALGRLTKYNVTIAYGILDIVESV